MAFKRLPTMQKATLVNKLAKLKAKEKAEAEPASTFITAKKCQAIIRKIEALGDLPNGLQQLLKKLRQGLAAKGKRHITEEVGTSVLGKAVRGVETALRARLKEAQQVIEGAEWEKEARKTVQYAAEASLEELKQAIKDKKAALAELARTMEEKRSAVQSLRSAQKSAEAMAKASEARKRHLITVEKESYEPLKERAVEGAGKKQLTTLCKFGWNQGFPLELMSVLPAILKKHPDRRRTFDNLAMQHLEVEFTKRDLALDYTVRHCESTAAQHAERLQMAHQALVGAKEEHSVIGRELTAAEATVAAGKKALVEARKHLRRLPADMRLAVREFALAEAKLSRFSTGPLAYYRKALPTQPEVVPGNAHSAAQAARSSAELVKQASTELPTDMEDLEEDDETMEKEQPTLT